MVLGEAALLLVLLVQVVPAAALVLVQAQAIAAALVLLCLAVPAAVLLLVQVVSAAALRTRLTTTRYCHLNSQWCPLVQVQVQAIAAALLLS